MSKLKTFLHFDQIEQKVVFQVSRTFFWIFVAIAGLSFVAAVLVLLYSIIPPGKEDVVKEQYPTEPRVSLNVSLEEIRAAVTPTPPQPKYAEPAPQVTQPAKQSQPVTKYKEPVDNLQLKINTLVDSLGTFIKSGWGITYESYITGYDWFGRPSYGQRVKRGLRSDLENILNEYFQAKQERITRLEFLIDVMRQIETDKREKALSFFIRSMKNKWIDYRNAKNEYRTAIDRIESDYNNRLASAEAEYAFAKLEKTDLSNKALMSIGSAIVLVALVGLILTFLAIERNTRAVKELLERDKKSEEK
ncbi:MAG: hypothetical protein FD122_3335 [Stygiobacter sp.]|nr:MAG: hypothetical protein FD122_3335 [Stygiobacter sp.]KAF0214784.1 MAG: hypothetical protein FD178_2157 [Ignavibacteria bacterium]